jgi:hypothetical protein
MKKIWLFWLFCLPVEVFAQRYVADSLALYYEKNLLKNQFVQLFATQAMNEMYNFKFEQAQRQFDWLREQYPEHPLPYFLLGMNESWKMVPNPDDPQHDDAALAYLEKAIEYGYELQKQEKKLDYQGSFFLAASYSLKARIHSDRGNWNKAIWATRKTLQYLRYTEKWEELSPEWLLGEGLYNYYREWISENYPLLRPVLTFFKRGNTKLGLTQLEKAGKDAFFVRIEALHFLMRIYRTEEGYPDKALTIAQYLIQTYPDNPYFQRYYVSCAYSQGLIAEAQRVGEEVLRKVEYKQNGYEEVTGRYATYFLGRIAHNASNYELAKRYYEGTVRYGEAIEAYDSGYYQEALLHLGRIYEQEKNYKLAKMYYERLQKHAKRSSDKYKEAKKKGREYKRNRVED